MKTRTISRRWLALTVMAFLSMALSGAALSAEFSGNETYRIAEGEVVDDDLYIGANEIYIDGTLRGDLIAGAQYIEIGPSGIVEGDLWAAGSSIVIKGVVLDDVRAAGAGIEIAGAVGDDAFLAGGGGQYAIPAGTGFPSIEHGVRISGEIGGDAFVAAGSADISGVVGGDFVAGLGAFDLSGEVGGDAEVQATEFRIDEAARIGGALKYTAPEQRELPAGVARDIHFEAPAAESAEDSSVGDLFGWILRTLAICVGVAILGWLLFRFRPNALLRPAAAIRANPMKTGLYGLLAAALLIFIPIASIALVAFTFTFWGAFPGIVMFIFLVASSAVAWFFSPLLTGLWLGKIIDERLGGDRAPILTLLLGALPIVILGRIPFLGWLVYLLSFALALGGLLRSAAGARLAQTEAAG